MKILIISCTHYVDQPGGSQKIAYDEAVRLRDRGDEVWMLSSGSPSLPEYEQRDGLHLLRYVPRKVAAWNPERRQVHHKAAIAILAKYLPQVDVLHGFTQLAYLAALEFYRGSVHSAYTITSPLTMEMKIEWKNSSLPRRWTAPVGLIFLKRIEGECLRRSRVITAMSQYTIDCIDKLYGAEISKRLNLVPGWVDTSRYAPVEDRDSIKIQLGWPTAIPTLFTLRRLVPRMGLDRLLHACHRLCGEGFRFRLVIGGDGPLRKKLEEQVEALGLNNTVTFMGRVAEDLMPLAYAACDAFVLPTSYLECFGLIALEAMSSGRPVLATPVGAIPEVICQFEPAWLAKNAEEGGIADLLRQYLSGKLPQHSPRHLYEQVDRVYRSEKVIDELIQIAMGTQEHA